MLNAILFVLIGMEMLIPTFEGEFILAGLLAIRVVVICRYWSLWLPIKLFEKKLVKKVMGKKAVPNSIKK